MSAKRNTPSNCLERQCHPLVWGFEASILASCVFATRLHKVTIFGLWPFCSAAQSLASPVKVPFSLLAKYWTPKLHPKLCHQRGSILFLWGSDGQRALWMTAATRAWTCVNHWWLERAHILRGPGVQLRIRGIAGLCITCCNHFPDQFVLAAHMTRNQTFTWSSREGLGCKERDVAGDTWPKHPVSALRQKSREEHWKSFKGVLLICCFDFRHSCQNKQPYVSLVNA